MKAGDRQKLDGARSVGIRAGVDHRGLASFDAVCDNFLSLFVTTRPISDDFMLLFARSGIKSPQNYRWRGILEGIAMKFALGPHHTRYRTPQTPWTCKLLRLFIIPAA